MDGFFHLAWGNHNSIIVQNFQRLQEKESFCDVTIVCDRKHFPLHKLVLSSCSKYFEEIFEETPCRHPFIVLKDFEAETFENLIEFMYKGEVNISQDRLPVFISAANSLKVKGISIPEESSLKKKRELVCSSLQPSKKSKNSKQKSIETSSDPETNKENGETAGTSESCLKDVEEAIESAQESCLLNVSKTSDSVECGESFGEMKHFMGEPVNFFLGSLKGTRVKQELDLMALADCNSYPSTSQEILSSSQNEDDQGFEFDASNFPEVAINQSTPSGPMQERGRDQLADHRSPSDFVTNYFEDNKDSKPSTSSGRNDTRQPGSHGKFGLLPEFSSHVCPYLNGEATDPHQITLMRTQIINQLIFHLNKHRLLLDSSRITQAWGYRRLANELLLKYPSIIREKSTRSRVAKGELSLITARVADRRRKFRSRVAPVDFKSPEEALSFLEQSATTKPKAIQVFQAIKLSKPVRDGMSLSSSLPVYLQSPGAITLELELCFKMKLPAMSTLMLKTLSKLSEVGASSVRSLVAHLSEEGEERLITERTPSSQICVTDYIGPRCFIKDLESDSVAHIYYSDKKYLEFKQLSPVKALLLTAGLYFILKINFPRAYEQVLGFVHSVLTQIPLDENHTAQKLKNILEILRN